MKKTKKILIVAIVIALLCALVAVIVIAAGLTENDSEASNADIKLDIVATNLSFSDSVYIKYAVDRQNITDDNDVKLLVWLSVPSSFTYGTEAVVLDSSGYQTIGGVDYIIFDYKDLAARQMTDDVYARAYANVDGKDCYSEVSKYSILKYAYNKLGKTGTATTNEKLVDLLENMLNYGALAQEYTGYKTDRLATASFSQIKVEGGTLADTFDSGLYLEGDKVTITASEKNNGFSFVGWKNADGEIVSTEATTTVTAGSENEVYSAVYQGTYSQGLEYTPSADGKSYIVSGMGECTDTGVVVPAAYNGKLVTGVAERAFANNVTIKSFTFTGYIEEIGASAITGCTSLSAIYYGGTEAEWRSIPKGADWDKNTGSYILYVSAIDNDWGIGGVPLGN